MDDPTRLLSIFPLIDLTISREDVRALLAVGDDWPRTAGTRTKNPIIFMTQGHLRDEHVLTIGIVKFTLIAWYSTIKIPAHHEITVYQSLFMLTCSSSTGSSGRKCALSYTAVG